MPLIIVRDDITKMKVDAIVNAANHTLLGGGGVDGCIHRAAGPKLREKCRSLGGCETGDAKITRGYDLPVKYIIHTVGPIWRGGDFGEEGLLISCYRKSLELARLHFCRTVAFPLISSGAYGYPKPLALRTAVEAIKTYLKKYDMMVYLVIYDRKDYQIGQNRIGEINAFIRRKQSLETPEERLEKVIRESPLWDEPTVFPGMQSTPSRAAFNPKDDHMYASEDDGIFKEMSLSMWEEEAASKSARASLRPRLSRPKKSLESMLAEMDESFSQMLLRKIDEKGMKDSECYKKANIDRKLFSKIRKDTQYKPSKPTVLAFAIALELSLPETKDMLMKAGYALSHSNKFDIIVEYFITAGIYDIHEINMALFEFDQSLLGGQ